MKLIPQNENRPGYKETKIGCYPLNWNDTILSSFVQEVVEFCNDVNTPLYSLTIQNGIIPKPKRYEREFLVKSNEDTYKKVRKDNFVYNPMNLRWGALALHNLNQLVKVSSYYNVFKLNKVVDVDFIYYFLKSERVMNFYNRMATGSLEEKKRVHFKDFVKFTFPIPPRPEQKKIAAILSTWDKAISNYELLIKNYELRKKGLMQKLLSGEVRFPGFTEPWQEVSLGEVFNERREANLQHLPLLAITGSAGVVNRDDLDRRDTSNKDKSKYKRICPGDIGYNTMRMWQGVSALSDLEGIVSPAYTIVTPKKEINALFASYLFKHHPVIFLFYRYSQGLVSDTWNLKFRHFSEVRVKIPSSLNEQIKIASLFKNIDDEVSILKQKKNSIEQQKKGLMQKLLTGTVRVKPIKN